MKVVLEMQGQPVQQFRMAGMLTGAAEILQGFHKTGSEKLLPSAIDRHPRGQRLVRGEEPLGQSQAIARRVCGKFGKQGRRVGGQVRADWGEKTATLEFQGRPPLIIGLFHLDWKRNAGDGFELAFQGIERDQFILDGRIIGKARRRRPRSRPAIPAIACWRMVPPCV